jgi:hypothetical protein
MKKLLLIGLILVICVLAFPQGVLADSAVIEASVVQSLSFSAAGSNVTSWNLYYFAPGPINTNTGGLNVAVSLNNPWHITLAGSGTPAGHLQPFGSGGYSGTSLNQALHIKNGADDQVVGAGATIFTSVLGTDGWTRHWDYVQTLVVTDDPATNYRIDLVVNLVNDGL